MTGEQRRELEREKERLSRLSPFERAVVGLLALLVAAMLYVLAQLVVPYRPLEVRGYSFVPEAVCPGEPVGVVRDWEVREPLRRLEVEYAWVESGSREDPELARFGGAYAVYDVEPRPRERLRSPIERETPTEPGKWRLITTYTAYGARLGLPLRAEVEAVSDDALRVLPEGDPKCARETPAGAREEDG